MLKQTNNVDSLFLRIVKYFSSIYSFPLEKFTNSIVSHIVKENYLSFMLMYVEVECMEM